MKSIKNILSIALVLLVFAGCEKDTFNDLSFLETASAPAPIGPYSQAVLAGNTLYVSGQIALNPETGEIENESFTIHNSQKFNKLKTISDEQ